MAKSKLFEVEQKFPLLETAPLRSRLDSLKISLSEPETQVDTYLAHPCRDFARTDEALRIRRVGDAEWITYKGPRQGQVAKTRREIELPLAPVPAAQEPHLGLLLELGFTRVAEVRKTRRRFQFRWQVVVSLLL